MPIVAEKDDTAGSFLRYYVWSPEGELLYMIDAADNKVYMIRLCGKPGFPASEVPGLKRDLANYKEFKELVGTLEQTIIAVTRARKSGAGGPDNATRDAKKNSANKRVSKSTAKPKTSSPKPKSS